MTAAAEPTPAELARSMAAIAVRALAISTIETAPTDARRPGLLAVAAELAAIADTLDPPGAAFVLPRIEQLHAAQQRELHKMLEKARR